MPLDEPVCAVVGAGDPVVKEGQIGVQLFMYATPVIYPLSAAPEKYRFILELKIPPNDAYFKILFYLNEVFFGDLLIQYMEKKKAFYPQYAIPLP